MRLTSRTIACLSRMKRALIFALFPFTFAAAAHAMSVSPIVVEMSSTGRHAKSTIRVVNDSTKKLPVEIEISRVELDANGGQKSTPAGDEFLIFPPQAIVAPGATQTFRVQWVGEPVIPESQTYIFSVNQVPVKMPKGQSGVQVVFNFGTVVNVAPPEGSASLQLIKAGIGRDAKNKRRPALTLKNSGNTHARLSDATITLSASGWSKTLTPAALKQSLGVGLVQPGKQRRVLIPVDLPAGVTKIAASINYKFRKH